MPASPFGLEDLVAGALRALVVGQPERAVRWLLEGGPAMTTVRNEDLSDVLGPLVDVSTANWALEPDRGTGSKALDTLGLR